MQPVSSHIALLASIVAIGCSHDRPKPSREALAAVSQSSDRAAQMKAEGQRLRAEGLAKKQRGQTADGEKQIAQGDKLISDAKLSKDRALLKADPPPDE